MASAIKKLFLNALIMAIVFLPFRMAFSMTIDESGVSSDRHCKGMTMAVMSQNSQIQSLHELSADVVDSHASEGNCCSTSDNDCAGCAHITAVYYYDFLRFSDLSSNEVLSEASLPFITRAISPPSRPPLVFHA